MKLIPAIHPFQIKLAGVQLNCCFSFPETAKFFGAFLLGPGTDPAGIRVSEAEWENWFSRYGAQNAYSEYTCFTACASDALLLQDRVIMHGVSFLFRDRAWLICAESGVGKSTQVHTLQELYPNQFSVICGDRTVLQLMEDGSVWAHPSPWNGKEGWHGAPAAPLAGILCLERTQQTEVRLFPPQEAVFPVLKQMISSYKDVESIHRLASFEDALLRRVPVWRYCNGGVPDSCRFLYDNLLCQEDKA